MNLIEDYERRHLKSSKDVTLVSRNRRRATNTITRDRNRDKSARQRSNENNIISQNESTFTNIITRSEFVIRQNDNFKSTTQLLRQSNIEIRHDTASLDSTTFDARRSDRLRNRQNRTSQ